MNREALKSIIREVVQEISADTMQAAAGKARKMGKHAQANRFYSAAEKKSGDDRAANLANALGNAPKDISIMVPPSRMSLFTKNWADRMVKITLTGMYTRGDTIHIEFFKKAMLGKEKGEIIFSKKDSTFFVMWEDETGLPDSTKFDRNGVIAMHKITGLENAYIPMINKLEEAKREALKLAIKKIVLSEITMNTNTVGTTDTLPDQDAEKALKKALPDDESIQKRPGSSKVTASGKHQVALSKVSEDCYDVVSITNGSDRRVAKNLKLEEVNDFIKKHADETKDSYVQKAFNKTSQGHGLKEDEKEEKEEADKMDDAHEEKQIDIADDTTEKADAKVDKELAPVDDEVAPQMGGELVDKIEKIIDRVLKDKSKAEPKSAHLKVDTSKESPDKLTTKLKDTPALKEKK